MAGTRGLAKFRGEQLKSGIFRDRHFSETNKINENKIDLKWADHKEILEATKIDVFVQANNQAIAGLSTLDVTSIIGNKAVSTGVSVEGVVTGANVEMRINGSEDFPYIDADGDRVYGKLRFVAADGTPGSTDQYFLDFFSEQAGAEAAYTFAATAEPADFRYVLRTNLSVIPVDAIVKGGSGFVEGATDANAHMNLTQLMKDLYGASGSLDQDGNANLTKSLVEQISDEVTARTNADTEIVENLASTLSGEGAALVGVVTDANYTGITVQAVLTELAAKVASSGSDVADARTRESASANAYFAERSGLNGTTEFANLEERLVDIETVADTELKDKETRITKLETEDDRFVFEAVGGETEVPLPSGKLARPNTLFVSLNGQLLAPGINYDETVDVDGNVTGVSFAPDALSGGVPGDETQPPDVVFMWFKLSL